MPGLGGHAHLAGQFKAAVGHLVVNGAAQALVVVLPHPLHGPGAASLGGVLVPLHGQLAVSICEMARHMLTAVPHACRSLGIALDCRAKIATCGKLPVFHGILIVEGTHGGTQFIVPFLAALIGEGVFQAVAQTLHVLFKVASDGRVAVLLFGCQHLVEQRGVFGGDGDVILHLFPGPIAQHGQVGAAS